MIARWVFLFLALAGLALAPAAAEDPAGDEGPSTEALARTCMGCHGEDGRSPAAMPTIAGKSAEWMARRLKAFREGEQPSTIMGHIMQPFADEDIDELAAYFAEKD